MIRLSKKELEFLKRVNESESRTIRSVELKTAGEITLANRLSQFGILFYNGSAWSAAVELGPILEGGEFQNGEVRAEAERRRVAKEEGEKRAAENSFVYPPVEIVGEIIGYPTLGDLMDDKAKQAAESTEETG